MKRLAVADTDGTQRVAVIRPEEGSKVGAPRRATELPILERHAQRHLDRSGSRVRVEHPREASRGVLDEGASKTDGGLAGEAEERRVGDSFQLVSYGSVELRAAVAVDVAPQRRHAIEVAASRSVDKIVALTALDYERLVGEPVRHLCERMPEILVIPRG
jgi:hypothetical protein